MKQLFRILIVDDDEVSISLTMAILQYVYEGAQIRTVFNGMQAMEYFLKNSEEIPELIFLDINMPIMNGFEFLEWYNNSAFKGSAKICMLSSSLNMEDKERAGRYNDVVGYINKPLQYESVNAFMESL